MEEDILRAPRNSAADEVVRLTIQFKPVLVSAVSGVPRKKLGQMIINPFMLSLRQLREGAVL